MIIKKNPNESRLLSFNFFNIVNECLDFRVVLVKYTDSNGISKFATYQITNEFEKQIEEFLLGQKPFVSRNNWRALFKRRVAKRAVGHILPKLEVNK